MVNLSALNIYELFGSFLVQLPVKLFMSIVSFLYASFLSVYTSVKTRLTFLSGGGGWVGGAGGSDFEFNCCLR